MEITGLHSRKELSTVFTGFYGLLNRSIVTKGITISDHQQALLDQIAKMPPDAAKKHLRQLQ